MQKERRKNSNKQRFSLVLDRDIYDEMRKEAARENRSANNFVLNCVKRTLAKNRELN